MNSLMQRMRGFIEIPATDLCKTRAALLPKLIDFIK